MRCSTTRVRARGEVVWQAKDMPIRASLKRWIGVRQGRSRGPTAEKPERLDARRVSIPPYWPQRLDACRGQHKPPKCAIDVCYSTCAPYCTPILHRILSVVVGLSILRLGCVAAAGDATKNNHMFLRNDGCGAVWVKVAMAVVCGRAERPEIGTALRSRAYLRDLIPGDQRRQ